MNRTAGAAGRRESPPSDDGRDPAWTLLEAVCRRYAFSDAGPEIGVVVDAVGTPGFSWGALLDHAVTHKLLGVVAWSLREAVLEPVIPARLSRFFDEVLDVNWHRIGVHHEAAVHVVAAAAAEGLPIVARKGLVLEHTVHRARGARVFGDIDFMVAPDDASRCHALLRRIGYVPGRYDRRTGAIRPEERRSAIVARLHPDHLPKMVRLTRDPVVRYVDVDVATSFTWASSEYVVPVAESLRRRESAASPHPGRGPLPAFPPVYQFIDVVLHIFREAYVEKPERDGNPVTLSAFIDVLLLWHSYASELIADGLPHLLRTLGIGAPVGWVLGHMDRLFGTAAAEALELDEHVTTTWLAGRRLAGGRIDRWHGDMRQRLRGGGAVHAPPSPSPSVARR